MSNEHGLIFDRDKFNFWRYVSKVEEPVIQGSLGEIGDGVREAGSGTARLQTGLLRSYALVIAASVVILVIRPAVEYLSIFSNENVCMFLYMLSLRLHASPVEAFAACFPAMIPNVRLHPAIRTMRKPSFIT